MAHYAEDIHHRTSTRLGEIVPQFIQAQYPQFFAFLKAYFEFLEQNDDAPIESVYVPQTGVVTILSGNSVATGSATTFTLVDRGVEANTTLQQYDRLLVGDELFTVQAVTNNTSLTLLDIPERNYYGNTYSIETQKSARQAAGALRQILTFHEIDETIPDFIKYFQDTYLRNFPRQGVDSAKLIPNILQFYQARGGEDSFRFLFRALFGKEITLRYPRDYTFTTSDATYERPVILKVSAVPPRLIYQVNTASSTNTFNVGEIVRASNTTNTNLGYASVHQVVNSTAIKVFSIFGDLVANATTNTVTLTGNTSAVTRTLTGNATSTGVYTTGLTYGGDSIGNPYSLESREIVGLTSNVRATVSQVREELEGTNSILSLNLEDVVRVDVPFNILISSDIPVEDGVRLLFTTFGVPPEQSDTQIYESRFLQEQKPGIEFEVGERISTVPTNDPLRIEATITGAVRGFIVESGGSGFRVGDLVYVPNSPPSINGYGAVGRVTALSTSEISIVNIEETGEGYYPGISLIVDNTGTGGTGLEGYISTITSGQLILHDDPTNSNNVSDGDVLMFSVTNPALPTTTVDYKSGLERLDYVEEGISLNEILSWKLMRDDDALSGDSIAAEGYAFLTTTASTNNFSNNETISASLTVATTNKFTVTTANTLLVASAGDTAAIFAGAKLSLANGSATTQVTVNTVINSTAATLLTVPGTSVTSGNATIIGSATIGTLTVDSGTFDINTSNTELVANTGTTEGLLSGMVLLIGNSAGANAQVTINSITNSTSAKLTAIPAYAVTAGNAYINVINSTALFVQNVSGTFANGATLTGASSTHTRVQSANADSVTLSAEFPEIGYGDWSMNVASSALYDAELSTLIEPLLLATTIVPIYINGVRTAIGEVEDLIISGIGRGYVFGSPVVTLPVPVQPRYSNGALVSRALYPYDAAVLNAAASDGIIGAVETVSGGSGYTSNATFTVNSSLTSSTTGNNASLRLVLGAQTEGIPRFRTTRSLASADQYMQDESTYQPFAYVLSAEEDYQNYGEIVKRFVHPAGGRLIPDHTITAEFNAGVINLDTLRNADLFFEVSSSQITISPTAQFQAYCQQLSSVLTFTAPVVSVRLTPVITTTTITATAPEEQVNLVIPAGPNGIATAGTETVTAPVVSIYVAIVIPAGPNGIAAPASETVTAPTATRAAHIGLTTTQQLVTSSAPTVTISTTLGASAGTTTLNVTNPAIGVHLFLLVNTIQSVGQYGNDPINQHGDELIEATDDPKPRVLDVTAPVATVS